MSRNADHVHLKLKPSVDGLERTCDKAGEKHGELGGEVPRKVLSM